MCLPPPNVTGDLHLGHALTVAIQDAMSRWHRMRGNKVIWIPGFDHAGIATQLVVEKQLWRQRGVGRKDLTRAELVEACELWKNKRVEKIMSQLDRFGTSLNWNLMYYTRDEAQNPLRRFMIIFQEINTISIDSPTELNVPGVDDSVPVGWMYFVDYYLTDNNASKKLTVGTTRPETILADEALAVNPRGKNFGKSQILPDDRYACFVGQRVRHPLLPEKTLPIVADDVVEPDFGTGVLKVTPAHDFNDYAIGNRQNLPLNTVCINELGRISEKYAEFSELNRFEARKKIVDCLQKSGHLVSRKPQQGFVVQIIAYNKIIETLMMFYSYKFE